MLAIQKAITEMNPCNTLRPKRVIGTRINAHFMVPGLDLTMMDVRIAQSEYKGDADVMRTEGCKKGEGANQDI